MSELLDAPERTEISDPRPEFGWIVHSARNDDRQTAYRIVVTAGSEVIWDSGKVESGDSVNVEYAGKPLAPNSSYTWKVKTWTALEGESEWSKPQTFNTSGSLGQYATPRYPLEETPVAPLVIKKLGENHYFLDFGRVAFGYLNLTLESPVAAELEIHLGERGSAAGVNKKPGGTVRYAKVKQSIEQGSHAYRVKAGSAGRMPPAIGAVMPFRYVEIVNCPVEIKTGMATQVAVHYPFNDSAASFESPNDVLNQIWELCRYSMKATSFCGIYVDGDRERLPYEADAYINQLSHYAVDREYTLARHSHEYLLKKPTWPTEWKQHSVLMAWADLMYTGNTESLTQCYDLLKEKKTLEQRARADGLLDTKGLSDIVDWPKGERDRYDFKPVNTVVNAFHYINLRQMQQFAKVLGKKEDEKMYAARADKVYKAFNEVLFDAERGVYVDGEGSVHASLHANMFPLAFGLVPEDRLEKVADFVVSRGMACSVYGAQYLMEGLYNAGRQDAAFNLLTSEDIRSWYNMIRVGSTITLEAWDNKFKGNQDWNHAWGAAPGNIIPRFLLGVRPLEPGFKKVLVKPMPGPLESASSVIPTIRGPIGVSLSNQPLAFELKVTIPVNMSARIGLPRKNQQSKTLLVNGKKENAVFEDGYLFVDGIGSGSHVLISQ
jgi:hypothetical protein